jgi:Tol biopolymer transport system component
MLSTRPFAFRLSVALGAAACALMPLSVLAQDTKPLLFISNRGDSKMKFNIYSMKPDGSEQKNLTKSDMMEFDPTFSPDGKAIVFIALKQSEKPDGMSEGGLYTMKADGSERKKLTDIKGLASNPVFSPDGKQIAFTSFTMDFAAGPPKFSLQVMDADGKNKKEIGEGIVSGWSPDGKKLLLARLGEGGGGGFDPALFIMDADGKNAKKLMEGKAALGVFSPDGKKIACIAEMGSDQPDLVVMNVDGSDKKQLTKTEDIEIGPQWSADGKSLYFTRFPKNAGGNPLDANISIFRIDADGKNEKALTDGKGMSAMSGSALFLGVALQGAQSQGGNE